MAAWSADENGQPIDWSKPPYRQGGCIDFSLPTDSKFEPTPAQMRQRVGEYQKLCIRERKQHYEKMQQERQQRKRDGAEKRKAARAKLKDITS